MKTKIKVTATHIEKGKQFCVGECAVALAIKQVVKPSVSVDASYTVLHLLTENDCFYIKPIREVTRFMERFDKNKSKCKPQTFTIDIPKEYLNV